MKKHSIIAIAALLTITYVIHAANADIIRKLEENARIARESKKIRPSTDSYFDISEETKSPRWQPDPSLEEILHGKEMPAKPIIRK